jgi:hypothetical protein
MTSIIQSIRNWFAPVETLPSGMYHYIAPPDDPRNYRLHLRVEPDGSGVLIVNAATILHLNQTATEYAYYIISNLTVDEATRKITARYHVTGDQARSDYLNLVERIQILVNTPDLDPETFLDFERKDAHHTRPSAPYRLDCALTYRLEADDQAGAAPVERVKRELSTAEWTEVEDKALEIGIPHLVFTGGEPTLRDDLAELIAHAEANGQVTGLISDGLRFADTNYMQQILSKGLDHILIVLDLGKPQVWSALENLLAADIFVAVHLTISPDNFTLFPELLSKLAKAGVKAISLGAQTAEMGAELTKARDQVATQGLELVWNLPAPYSHLHPVAMETGKSEQMPGAGSDWLYLEPDGDVLPTQGVNQVLGNFLQDPWEKIWKK